MHCRISLKKLLLSICTWRTYNYACLYVPVCFSVHLCMCIYIHIMYACKYGVGFVLISLGADRHIYLSSRVQWLHTASAHPAIGQDLPEAMSTALSVRNSSMLSENSARRSTTVHLVLEVHVIVIYVKRRLNRAYPVLYTKISLNLTKLICFHTFL